MKLGWFKKLTVKSALGIAKMFVTPELIKDEARKGLTEIAARAHSGDKTRCLMERTKNVISAMEDGIVSVEETEMILGDIVTQGNIDSLFAYIEKKVG